MRTKPEEPDGGGVEEIKELPQAEYDTKIELGVGRWDGTRGEEIGSPKTSPSILKAN